MAIDCIVKAGVPEDKIVFINVVASEAGIEKVMTRFPSLRLVTAAVDKSLTESK
jgi:uracil phosphoribosyltransferase